MATRYLLTIIGSLETCSNQVVTFWQLCLPTLRSYVHVMKLLYSGSAFTAGCAVATSSFPATFMPVLWTIG